MDTRNAGLGRATATLLAGGLAAQALPLLLGPWLARLYSPQEYGQYTAFAVVAANLAVVACARYEFALPLARDAQAQRALLALCLRLLLLCAAVVALVSLWPGLHAALGQALWLAPAVLAAGAAQVFTQLATREQRFAALAWARVGQHGGAALLQLGAGLAQVGVVGLVAGPVLAAAGAALGLAQAPQGGWRSVFNINSEVLRQTAVQHREFSLFNTPHAFAGALQDTLAVALIVAFTGDMAAGFWGLALRYLKAPATLVGSAVAQALYPKLALVPAAQARAAVRQVMGWLALAALPLALLLLLAGPALFAFAFGEDWRTAGELARALAPYIALHFVASPLGVVTMAWQAQAWALRLALLGQLLFLLALGAGLLWGGLLAAAWSVSLAMCGYFGWYFYRLATWPLDGLPVVAESAHERR